MPQTTVSLRQGVAISEGQRASTAPHRIDGAIERYVNGLNAVLPFGRVVVVDPTDTAGRKIILPTDAAANQPPIGVTILSEEYGVPLVDLTSQSNPPVGYPATDSPLVGVASIGDYYLWSEEPVTVADIRGRIPVLYRYSADAAPNNQLGRIRKTAVASKTSTLPNARFLTPTAAAGLVLVRIGG